MTYGTEQGTVEQIGVPQNGLGLRITNQGPRNGSGPHGDGSWLQDESGPAGRIRTRGTNQGPSSTQTRAPPDKSGSREMDQNATGRIRTPLDDPELCTTNQSAVGRIWSPQDESGPAGRTRSP